MEAVGYAQKYHPSVRERIGRALFGRHRHVEMPDYITPAGGGLPVDIKDGVTAHVTCYFSAIDRIRLLFSGRCRVDVKIATENRIGEHQTASGVNVLPPKILSPE